jgi:hypothetical protein
VSLVLLALAWAALIQAPGANQNSHLALLTSVARGTPRIDQHVNWTGDRAYIDGHYYADKAPGLALITTPWFLGLRAAGLTVDGPSARIPWPDAQSSMPSTAIWEVALFGATLPAFLVLLLMRSVADRFVPGYGTVAAVTVGAGSVLGVLATTFFAHAMSACVGFAAFALLVRERERHDLWLVMAAGFLAGFAAVVEFPLAIVGMIVGVYGVLGTRWRRRGLAYLGGFALGLVPLAAFNTWAFGSPATLAYTNAVISPGATGHDVIGANASGFFGVGLPSIRAAVELLFSGHGLVVLTPIAALVGVGLVALWRRGEQREAAVTGAIIASFLVYNAAYYAPFGGFPAGTRFLVAILPFFALPIAAAWRALPGTALVLGLASIIVTTACITGQPFGPSEDSGAWFSRLVNGSVTRTVFSWIPGLGAAQILPVLVLVAAAVATALLVTPSPRIDRNTVLQAVVALLLWWIVYSGTPIMLRVDRNVGGWEGAAAVIVLFASSVALLLLLAQHTFAAILPALVLIPIAWSRFAAHTGVSLVAVSTALFGLVAVWLWHREPSVAR